MIACLRSAHFYDSKGKLQLSVEARRHHNTRYFNDKLFTVVLRRPGMKPVGKSFGAYREAMRHWDVEVRAAEDASKYIRCDPRIVGFHEEG